MKIALVGAHRGDAGLSLGLAVETWLARGHAVEVICAFARTEYAPYSDVGSVHENDRMSFASATRRREDESWVKQYRGKLTLTDLNLKDAPLRLHVPAAEVFGLAVHPDDKGVLKLRKALERARPDAVVAPLAVDGHVDRVSVREAVLTLSGLPMAFYEDMPLATADTEERIADAVSAAALGVGEPLRVSFASEAKDGDVLAAAVARKRRLGLCFDSVWDDATVDAVAASAGALGGRERLWGNAAWRGSSLALPGVVGGV
jgi:hypothetical protein